MITLMTLAPGHFHAALVHREMLPGVDTRVHVYAPPGPELLAHLERVFAFASRPDSPTSWQWEVHASEDHVDRCLRERPGNAVIIAGRNSAKIEVIRQAVSAGLHVLVDKPIIIDSAHLSTLEATLAEAESRRIVVMDMLTERFEVTNRLVRALVGDPEVFGTSETGLPTRPGILLESVHHIRKDVSGRPLRRPTWFFDPAVNGEGLSDVGVHLADLAAWILYPDTPLDHRSDVRILDASRWPTPVSADDYHAVTGTASPSADAVAVPCNNSVTYSLRGVQIRLTATWEVRSSTGGDTGQASFQGSRCRVAVRHGPGPGELPQVSLSPTMHPDVSGLMVSLGAWCERHRDAFPGVDAVVQGDGVQLRVPDALRSGHESHFARVLALFLRRVRASTPISAAEREQMLARYAVTTLGVEAARIRGEPAGFPP